MVNKHLLHDLSEMGLWSSSLKNKIVYDNGSVMKIPEIPEELKNIYKYRQNTQSLYFYYACSLSFFALIVSFYCIRTIWEIKQKILVDMAVDRGCYTDQSQSLNIHMDQADHGKLTSLHFYTWTKV